MTNIVPITKDDFTGKSWQRSPNFLFAAHDMICPLTLEEVPRAMAGMPLAFTRENDRYSIVAVLGLQESTNFFVNSEGSWRGNYVPALYRGFPFVLAENEAQEGQFVLCFNQDSELLVDDESAEPFFSENGDLDETIEQIKEFLAKVHTGRVTLNAMCKLLEEHDLIEPWELVLPLEDGNKRLEGLYRVSETKLNELSDEDFIKIRQAGILPVIYSQLLSMQGITDLIKFAQAVAKNASQAALDELDFGGADSNENISFDNL